MVTVASGDPIGKVIGSNPPAETIVNRGSQVSIEVSAGLLVPDVTGQELDDASDAVPTAGFENVSIEASEKSGKHEQGGTVEHRDPHGNSYADASSTVTLYVYKPPAMRAVEVLIEEKESAAPVDPSLRRLIESGPADDEVAVLVRLVSPTTQLPPQVHVVSRFDDIVTVRVRRGALEALHAVDDVRSVKSSRTYRPEVVRVDAEAVEVADDDEHRAAGLEATGRGVVVGARLGPGRRAPCVSVRCAQPRRCALKVQSAAMDPARHNRFGYGRAHTRAAIDAALATPSPSATLGYDHARWDLGGGTHGTATTSIAARSEWEGGVCGVAPDADIVFVNLGGDEPLGHSVAIAEGIDFVREVAGTRPWVVNLSLGRHGGPHDGSTLLEQLLDAAVTSRSGALVVNSAGNYYSADVHSSLRLAPGERVELPIELTEGAVDVHELDVWYRREDQIVVGLVAPSGESIVSRAGEDAELIVGGVGVARLQHRANDPNNGKNEAVARIQPNAPAGTWRLLLAAAEVVDGRVHVWLEREGQHPRSQARFARDDADTRTSPARSATACAPSPWERTTITMPRGRSRSSARAATRWTGAASRWCSRRASASSSPLRSAAHTARRVRYGRAAVRMVGHEHVTARS